jgi:hypothetical protein
MFFFCWVLGMEDGLVLLYCLDRIGLDWMLVYPLWSLLLMHFAIDLLKDELLNSDM